MIFSNTGRKIHFPKTNNKLEILADFNKNLYKPKQHQAGINQSIFCLQYSFHSIVLRALYWLPYLRYK